MKIRSKHIKEILHLGGVDFKQNSKVSEIKLTHPEPTTSLYSFRLDRNDWAILFDEEADDNLPKINNQIPWQKQEITIFKNPNSDSHYSIPYQQKTVYLIKKQSNEIRLDIFLAEKYAEFSRSKIQKMIKNSLVKVNNQVITTAKFLINPETDQITLNQTKKLKKSLPKIEIIYQDDDIIAINKPAGVLTHPISPDDDSESTIADFIAQYGNFKEPNYRSGVVHRLDRATSGVLLLGKNDQVVDSLKKQFKDRQVQKTYIAISRGNPKHYEAKINLPLKRSIKQAGKFMVDASGKEAISNYKIIASKDNYHRVEIKPKTGRTHQIRVHLSYINLPIVGDYLYDGQKADRLYLHAKSIIFTNLDGKKIELDTDLPESFNKWA